MRILRNTTLLTYLFCFLSGNISAQTDNSASGLPNNLKLRNGLNAAILQTGSSGNAEIALWTKAGTVYETDTLNGISNLVQYILSAKIKGVLRSNKAAVSSQNTGFKAISTSEHTIYQFTTSPALIPACLDLIRDSIFGAEFSESEIISAKDSVLSEIETGKQDSRKRFEEKILKSLYRQDFEKLNIQGTPAKLNNIHLSNLLKFYRKYYVPNNALVTATGNINYETFYQVFSNSFSVLVKSEFNPESVTKIIDFRPMALTTQFITEDSAGAPEFTICWQFPGTSTNEQASYSAWLLCAMLNDKNNFIQVKAAKMGCLKFTATYEANNFNGVLKILLRPSKANLYSTYQFVMTELLRLDKTLVNESMINAAKIQFKSDYRNLSRTKEFVYGLVKHWAYDNDAYYLNFADSVFYLPEWKLRNFVNDYINQSPHVTGLMISNSDRINLQLDSVFNEVDENIKNYEFTYRQNITDLEGPDNLVMLNNLVQWLQINNDVHVQVNGFSDEGEFGKARNDTIMQFLDSIPTFRKSVPELLKKGYLRPEMMRAVKIIKYLHEHGVPSDRLSGTSMKYTSSSDEEAIHNYRCTISLEKLRQNNAMQEIHKQKMKE